MWGTPTNLKTRTSRPKRKVNRLYMEKRERPKGERGTAITRRNLNTVNTPYYSIMIIVIFRAKFVATRAGRLRTGDDRRSKIHRVCFESIFHSISTWMLAMMTCMTTKTPAVAAAALVMSKLEFLVVTHWQSVSQYRNHSVLNSMLSSCSQLLSSVLSMCIT